MQVTIQIIAQYYENYAFNSNGEINSETPHWKPKGSSDFEVKCDLDIEMYAQDKMINAIQIMLNKASSDYSKYTYISHDVAFEKARIIDQDEFDLVLKSELEVEV